jgi:hypothetical protein
VRYFVANSTGVIASRPDRTIASLYHTAVGAEIDLLLEILGHGLWAIEINEAYPVVQKKTLHSLP